MITIEVKEKLEKLLSLCHASVAEKAMKNDFVWIHGNGKEKDLLAGGFVRGVVFIQNQINQIIKENE